MSAASAEDRSNPNYRFNSSEFDEPVVGKFIGGVHGGKGVGKSTDIIRSLPGRIAVLSFDKTAPEIKRELGETDRVRVIDATKYYNDILPETVTRSAVESFNYIDQALTYLRNEFRPHHVISDGSEIVEQMAEMKMRFMHGLAPTQGFAELNWWKDRTMIMRGFNRKCLDVASVSVWYTMHTTMKPLEVTNGNTVTGRKKANWIKEIEDGAIVVMEATAEWSSVAKRNIHYLTVESSKRSAICKTGDKQDVTDKAFVWGPEMAERVAEVEAGRKVAPAQTVNKVAVEFSQVISSPVAW